MSIVKIFLLVWAIFLDLVGLIILILDEAGVGIPLSFLPDVLGCLTIGVWGLLKGDLSVMDKILKVGGSTLVEIIPFLGDAAPSWTITVLLIKD